MGTNQEVEVLSGAGHRDRRETQLRKSDRPWEGSVERSCGLTNRNRIEGDAERGEWADNHEALMAKAQAA